MSQAAKSSGSKSPIKQSYMIGWFIFALSASFYCYEYILRVSPGVMSHQLMKSYHLDATGYGNLTAFYYYIYSPLQLVVGLLMDRYGPRRLLTLAAFSCCLGIYLFAATTSLSVAEAGRFLIGFGSAFAFVGVLKLASMWLPPNRFAMIAGSTAALGVVGGIMGEYILTDLVSSMGWRMACYIVGIAGIVVTLLIFVFIRDRSEAPNFKKDKSKHQIKSFKAALPGLKQLLQNRQLWINGFIGMFLYLLIAGFADSWEVPYLTQAAHFTQHQAVFATSMVFAGWATGGPIIGFLSDYFKQRRLPLTLGSAAAAVVVSILIYMPALSYSVICSLFFILGFCASSQVIVFPISRESSPEKLTATAIAFTNMLVMISGFFVFIIGYLLDLFWSGMIRDHMHVYTGHDYQIALSVLPAGMIITVILTFFLKETHCKPMEEEELQEPTEATA